MATSDFGRLEMFRCSRSNLETSFAADLQESQRMAPIRKQKVKHPVDLHVYNSIVACKYGQHKMIIWQFSRIMQTGLVMAKWIIADCMTSRWVNLSCSQCKHESQILSRCFKPPPCLYRSLSNSMRCKPLAAVLTDVGGMAFRRLAVFFSPAVTSWISRAFGETIISVIFAAEWSPEILWHLIQCSQTVSAANSTIPKLTLQWTPQKKMQRSSRGKLAFNCGPVNAIQLVMAKWIIADCMTSSWLWVNLSCSQCKHESEILSRCFKCPAPEDCAVFQTEAFSVWKGSTGLVKPLFACWPIQASSLHSANLKRPSERPSKAIVVFKSSKKTKMFAMKTGVLKSPPCCSSPLRIPKVQRPSKTSFARLTWH